MSNPTPLRHLLVATDFSPAAERAIEHAVDLARGHSATLLLVHASAVNAGLEAPPWPAGILEPPADGKPAPRSRELEEEVARLAALGLRVRGACRPGPPARVILEEAERSGADLIVVGTHGQSGWRHFLLGSTTRRVIEHAGCPVLAVHQGDVVRPAGGRVLLFATDYSATARRAALRAAEILSIAPDDTVVLCHAAYLAPAVVPAAAPFSIPELEQLIIEDARKSLEREGLGLQAAGIPCRTEMIEGYPADVLVEHAKELDAAMIVAGSVGRTGLAHLLIGSTAERIASLAKCPVLVVPPGRSDAAQPPAASGA
jgi:nucleotide-binding universal stress UspA family protein